MLHTAVSEHVAQFPFATGAEHDVVVPHTLLIFVEHVLPLRQYPDAQALHTAVSEHLSQVLPLLGVEHELVVPHRGLIFVEQAAEAPAPLRQYSDVQVVHVVPPAHAAHPGMAEAAEHTPATKHGVLDVLVCTQLVHVVALPEHVAHGAAHDVHGFLPVGLAQNPLPPHEPPDATHM